MITFTRGQYVYQVDFNEYEPKEQEVNADIDITLNGIEITSLSRDIDRMLLEEKYLKDLEQLIVSESAEFYINYCNRIRQLKIDEDFLEYAKNNK